MSIIKNLETANVEGFLNDVKELGRWITVQKYHVALFEKIESVYFPKKVILGAVMGDPQDQI